MDLPPPVKLLGGPPLCQIMPPLLYARIICGGRPELHSGKAKTETLKKQIKNQKTGKIEEADTEGEYEEGEIG